MQAKPNHFHFVIFAPIIFCSEMKWSTALQIVICALTYAVRGQDSPVLSKPEFVQDEHMGRGQQYGSWEVTRPVQTADLSQKPETIKRSMAWDFTKKDDPEFFDVSFLQFLDQLVLEWNFFLVLK